MFNSNSNLNQVIQSQGSLPKVQSIDLSEELKVFYLKHRFALPLPDFKYYLTKNQVFPPRTSTNLIQSENEAEENQYYPGFIFSSTIPDTNYDFELLLVNKIKAPICKCKYFSIKLYLRPLGCFAIPTSEQVEIEAGVYDMESAKITKNMRGGDILRGNYRQQMNYFINDRMHVAYFRIQITEVSSHYLGKFMKLKIKACNTGIIKDKNWRVKPIIFENLTVKAKENTSGLTL
jgi:hypothetical protein